MTKRKRTPPPTPPPRRSVIFEVPKSLWSFQAIARELARQSELLSQENPDLQDQKSRDSQHSAPGAPRFDAQTFQTNALRFSPYFHQPFLPSQPWPQAAKPTSASHANSNLKESTTATTSRAGRALPDEHGHDSPGGPDDQLFDELKDALNADDDGGGMHGLDHQQQYLSGGNRITFDPHFPGGWNGQAFIQSYPQISSNHTSQPSFTPSTTAHHPPRNSNNNNNNLLPSSPTNVSPSFYHPKPQPLPPPHRDAAQSLSNIPGYYKTSLKLWSQQGHSNLTTSPSSRPRANQFESVPSNSSYPQIPSYSGNTAYPPPSPLASSPVTAFTTTNYGGVR